MSAPVKSRDFPMFIVDAFSSIPFGGNPAAICLLDHDQDIPDETKQKLASEMNLSETAFVSSIDKTETLQSSKRFRLRWFTPTVEVDLCGHATLATSAVLFQCCENKNENLSFETLSGQLFASRQGKKVILDFPNVDSKPVPGKFNELVKLSTCGQPVAEVLFSTTRKLLIRLEDSVSRCGLESLSPNLTDMHQTVTEQPVLGVIVTVKGTGDYDFCSRYFGPWTGVNEDPVTGSAHSVLTPYWARVLGKKTMLARQCSKRGGDLHLNLRQDGRVEIGGEFKVVLKGTVFV